MRIVVGISGASGAIYGVRTVEALHRLGVEVHLVMSQTAGQTIEFETGRRVVDVTALAHQVHDIRDMAAHISSGSFKTDGMVVAPCSIKSLSGIANPQLITCSPAPPT